MFYCIVLYCTVELCCTTEVRDGLGEVWGVRGVEGGWAAGEGGGGGPERESKFDLHLLSYCSSIKSCPRPVPEQYTPCM